MKKLVQNFAKVTEVELIYRNKQRPSERPHIKNSRAAYDLLLQSWDEGKIELQEHFKVMLLDRKNACLGISTISTGGLSSCVVDPKLVFATAIKGGAAAIILAHNHPSGNLTPSQPDRDITARLIYAGNILEIPIVDHIILAREGYLSFADEGLLHGGNTEAVKSWDQLIQVNAESRLYNLSGSL